MEYGTVVQQDFHCTCTSCNSAYDNKLDLAYLDLTRWSWYFTVPAALVLEFYVEFAGSLHDCFPSDTGFHLHTKDVQICKWICHCKLFLVVESGEELSQES